MRSDQHGIHIQRNELGALLAFCGDTSANNVVKFLVGNAGKMSAIASDGKRMVEAKSSVDVEGATAGEWAVDRNYLETMRRVLDEGETEGLLKVSENGVRAFHVIGIESGDVRRKIDAPSDVASTQLAFDVVRKMILNATGQKGAWFALKNAHLKDLNEIMKATKCPVSLQGGEDPTAPVAFMATCEHATWSGLIMPTPVTGFGDEAEEKGDDDDDAPGSSDDGDDFKLTPELTTQKKRKPKATAPVRKKTRKARAKAAPAEAADADEEDDESDDDESGIVGDDYPAKLATQKTARKKSAKKTAKKKAKRK